MKQKQGFLNHRCWWSLPSRTSFDLATSCRFWLSWLCLDIQGMMHSFYQGVASLDEKCGVFIIRGPCWTKLCCFISWFSSRKQRVQRKRTEIHRIHAAVMKYSNQRNSFEHPSGYFRAARILRQKPTYMQRLRKMVKRMRASWTAGSETWEHWVFHFCWFMPGMMGLETLAPAKGLRMVIDYWPSQLGICRGFIEILTHQNVLSPSVPFHWVVLCFLRSRTGQLLGVATPCALPASPAASKATGQDGTVWSSLWWGAGGL